MLWRDALNDDRGVTTWKNMDGNILSPIEVLSLLFDLEGMRKTMRNLRIAGVLAGIRSEYLSNTYLERCGHDSPCSTSFSCYLL
jgi:hypothetical protein